MTTPPITELTTRARDVFRLVVDAYLENGQPVGSRTLSKLATLNLSPASIRNVMQDLEELGLLASPHTSAGRLPTEQGLRLFVDGMMQVAEPSAEDRAQIEASLAEGGPIESALAQATATLSGLSACAGLVLVPKHERVLKQVAFVPMADRQALVVLVAGDGSVENRVIDLPAGLGPSALVEAGNYISAMLGGLTLAEAMARVRREIEDERIAIDRAAADLVSRGLAIWSVDGADRPVLIVRGQANSARRQRGRRSRPGAPAARRARNKAGHRRPARQRARRQRDAHFHRVGEQALFAVGFVGYRRALSRIGWTGGRRRRGYRPDPLELCAHRSHGGFYSTIALKTDTIGL